MTLGVTVAGAAGRMGRLLVSAVHGDPGMVLVGATEAAGSSALGVDAGSLAGVEPAGVTVVSEASQALAGADVLVDFTTPEATLETVGAATAAGVGSVVGTTGLSPAQSEALARLAARAPIVFAPNFSVGIHVLAGLVADAVARLGPGYDIEIVELHHRYKADAPSGTALHLARAAAGAAERDLAEVATYTRHGRPGARRSDEIGLQSLRGGDATGEHTVFLLGDGERLELTHRTGSRDAFVTGALRAARWLGATAPSPGLYSLDDVLGPGGDLR